MVSTRKRNTTMLKPGKQQHHRRSDFVPREDAEFFKVFLPRLSSRQLLIPPDFVKDFKRTMRERVILKVHSGKMWNIDVEHTQKGVFLKNGWSSFVKDQCLEAGDFLVFQYDKCFTFRVTIFGINECRKDGVAAGNTDKLLERVKVEKGV